MNVEGCISVKDGRSWFKVGKFKDLIKVCVEVLRFSDLDFGLDFVKVGVEVFIEMLNIVIKRFCSLMILFLGLSL